MIACIMIAKLSPFFIDPAGAARHSWSVSLS